MYPVGVAGFWRKVGTWLGLSSDETLPQPIDVLIADMVGRAGTPSRVSRAEALSVSAVQRGRNLICSVATLPLVQYAPSGAIVRSRLLEQVDPEVANVVTLAQTIEDLLFESVSWWRITQFGPDGYPLAARHLDYSAVSLEPPSNGRTPAPLPSGIDPREGVVWVDGQPVGGRQIIRFDSPNPPLLVHGARAIRRAVLLDAAASLYADEPRPMDYFSPVEGADPATDAEIQEILDEWKAARKKRSTGYVPASLKYNVVDQPSPRDLQLVELQKQAGLDLANALGIDPEELGISTTSRTYANAVDRRKDRVNDVLSPFMKAITDRLSMGDVTRRGYTIGHDLDDYMRADPLTRVQYYEGLHGIGAMTRDEIRAEEKLPPLTDAQRRELEPPAPREGNPMDVEAARLLSSAGFAGEDGKLQFADIPVHEFRVDRERRIVEGLALPYGKVASKYGVGFRFARNSLKWSEPGRVKLLRDHDFRQAIGRAEKLTDTPSGLRVRFKVARGAEGDRALELAEDGVLDGLSVGVEFDAAADTVPDPDNDGGLLVRRADLREVSLTPMPAFDDARVTKVAASRTEGNAMEECATCGKRHAPGAACSPEPAPQQQPQNTSPAQAGMTLSQDQLTALLARPGALEALVRQPQQQQAAEPAAPAGALTLSADQVDSLIRSGGLGVLLGMPQLTPASRQTEQQEERQVVNPTRRVTASVSVDEGMPYQFDRKGNLTRGTRFDFSTDLISGARGDTEALERAQAFVRAQFAQTMRAQFDTDRADVAGLNPNRNRPDLYVDQQEFSYPIWDAISKGTLQDSTPFVLPKFSSASGLVANHTEGQEPTPGTYTATAQTITPTAVSGKVEITREAWEQGGNPQLSGIIWRQMLRAWFEALEAAAVATLDGLTPASLGALTAGGGTTGQTLVSEMTGHLAGLRYVRGGLRMRDMFLQVDLYKGLINAKDNDGRPLLPQLNPVNSDGQVSDFFADVMIGGLRGRPAWALAASSANAASSYLFDRNDVHGWASAPQRLQFEYRVAYVDVAIWGYKALAVTDLTGVREISYDPVTP